MSTVLAPTPEALQTAVTALRHGGLVGLPTETVYGLAALALDGAAVARIYEAKARPAFNPLIVHVPPVGLDQLDRAGIVAAGRLSPAARTVVDRLLAAAWPGPLTLVLPRGGSVPDLTTAGLDTVGVRAPDHPVAQAVLAELGAPLAAPSANRSGAISPTRAADVAEALGDRVAWVLDGGPCRVGVESSVVHVSSVDGALTLLRPGRWSAKALHDLVGVPVRVPRAEVLDQPRSPGMTSRHYAPQTPFVALPRRLPDLDADSRAALLRAVAGRRVHLLCWTSAEAAASALTLQELAPHSRVEASAIDSEGRPSEVARRIYATLRELDRSPAELLLTEPFPPPELGDTGLLHALRDRMARATEPLR